MLTDPLSVTFNSVAKSLVRVSTSADSTVYATTDGEFRMSIRETPAEDGVVRREIILTHNYPDPTPDPFSGGPASVPNRFGLVYEVNSNGFYSSTEIPLLRTALLAFVDSTLQGRLLAGEK
jgi:hypothetical protein